MLFVILIIGVLVGVSLSAFEKMKDSLAPRQAAMEFVSALKSAREYSFDNSVRTRLVFADSAVTTSLVGTGLLPTNSYAVYAFYIPQQPMGGTQYSLNNIGNEFSLMPILSIPSGFVGEWVPCRLRPKWATISPRVSVTSTPDIFSIPAANFYASNYYAPPQTWVPVSGSATLYGATSMASTYPLNYFQTPYPYAYRLITTNAPQTEPSYVQVGGVPLYYGPQGSAIGLWPTNVNYRYFNTTTNANTLGTPQTSVTDDRRFFDLKGVEFDTRGYPTFTTNQIIFRFTGKNNTNNYYEVVIDSVVGIPRIKK